MFVDDELESSLSYKLFTARLMFSNYALVILTAGRIKRGYKVF